MNKIYLSYVAGFLDGEACVTLMTRKRNDVVDDVWAEIQACQSTSKRAWEVFTKIKESFGGHLREYNPSDNRKPFLRWCISSQKASSLAKLILPYSVIKKRHLEIIIRYQELRRKHNKKRSLPFTEKEWQERRSLLKEIRRLNKRGK